MTSKAILLLAAAALASACSAPCRCQRSGDGDMEHSSSRQYRWINPLLDCDTNMEFLEYRSFRKQIEGLLERAEKTGRLEHASVYFRDLNNGPWFGVNEREEFVPASLSKLPLLIGVLKLAESDPGLLSQTLEYGRSVQVREEQRFSGRTSLQPDTAYTLEQLASAMVRYSDNTAAVLILRVFGAKGIQEVYDDLGVPLPADGMPVSMQIKQYAALFRLLYNASYLSRAMSEKALGWLAESEFKEGLEAGVPKDVRVAHKYGERVFQGEPLKQLHDCGIVYYPNHPYLLCIMTRGQDFDGLKGVIQDLSSLVYREVDAQVRAK